MKLNTLKPNEGSRSKKFRKGKGHASGLGKTSGRGHKGQKARSGGFHKVGFEGGQMPLQRRLPKRGFTSLNQKETSELRLDQLEKVQADIIDLDALKNENLVPRYIQKIKVIATGELNKAVTIQGLGLTENAKKAVIDSGGKILD
ncbi:MAG TPA: 50S ribosomal protein L15 [Gammaproteobacteria bacterium]|jgi:large subunit ribosomal protein L15|nr:50S ribosomal protein L15 [Gammaproteobacteria bacterium]HIK77233.1 50S ribosomal protein L15 [Gammaproteobacteria bacterium]|tara:strand:+ start:22 stop:456 length:435 start_codon:yes stop_codon:yes gene_type:complete